MGLYKCICKEGFFGNGKISCLLIGKYMIWKSYKIKEKGYVFFGMKLWIWVVKLE